MAGGFGQGAVPGSDRWIRGDPGQHHHRAQLEPLARVVADAIEPRDRLEIDEPGGRQDAFLHQIQQVQPAGLGEDGLLLSAGGWRADATRNRSYAGLSTATKKSWYRHSDAPRHLTHR